MKACIGQWFWGASSFLAARAQNRDLFCFGVEKPEEAKSFPAVSSGKGRGGVLGLLSLAFAIASGSAMAQATISGTVYDDTSGTGNVAAAGGAPNISVELYKGDTLTTAVFVSAQTTSTAGAYIFSTDSANSTYYIRIKQPQINSINAAQTWAGVGGTQNVSTAFCFDDSGNTQEITASGICRGVRFAGSDPATNDLADAQIVSRVVITTDQEVAHADFGISAAASFGDASDMASVYDSSNFKVHYDAGGPFHVIANNLLRLGDTVPVPPLTDGVVDTNSNAHPSDDGVFVEINGADMPLQNAVLANGRNDYKLKIKVNGPFSEQGWLNVWDNTGTSFAIMHKYTDLQDTANSGEILLSDYSTRPSTGAPAPIITRFRFSSTSGLPAQSATPGAGQQPVNSTDTTKPWVVDGEVEDYQTMQTNALVRLAAVSQGGVGTFTYQMPSEISVIPPSVNTGTLTTVTQGERVDEAISIVHATSSFTNPRPVQIIQTLPDPTKWAVVSVECRDSVNGTLIMSGAGNSITIPSTATGKGGDITCLFINKYTFPASQFSTLVVTPDGPVSADGTSAYTATVTLANAAGVTPGATVILATAPNGSMLAGTATGTFAPGTGSCTTDSAGQCVVTWTSTQTGTFNLTARLADGTDVSGSSASRSFYGLPNLSQSTLVASPAVLTANGISTSIVTATIRDNNSFIIPGPTVVYFEPLAGVFVNGELSGSSCTTDAGGSCSVTYTSPYSVPPGGGTVITATVGGLGTMMANITLLAGTTRVITVAKSVTGAGYVDGGKFDITVACGNAASTILHLANGETGYAAANMNDVCRITEADPTSDVIGENNSNAVVISPSEFGVTGDARVAVTNRIVAGMINKAMLTVTKNVNTSFVMGMGHDPATVFPINIDCNTLPLATLNLLDGQSGVVEAEIGETCMVSEDVPAALAGHEYAASVAPSNLIVHGTTAIAVENVVVADTVNLHTVTITNRVGGQIVGSGYSVGSGVFTVTLNCSGGYNWTSTMVEGDTATYSVPDNVSCSLSEIEPPGSLPVLNSGYVWNGHTVSLPGDTFAVIGDVDATVTHNIELSDTRFLTVTKHVDGAGYLGGAFDITVTCNGTPTVLHLVDGQS
ncbi:MAG: hypothetical protein LBB65_00020, partial [Burkholderiales bacterium]|nr:hypothetical protein [Burkholderiales bacterium]